MVKHCPKVEVVRVIGRTRRVCVSSFDQQVAMRNPPLRQDHDLMLGSIPIYARGEAVEQWCKSNVREIIVYNEVVDFVSWNVFEFNSGWPITNFWSLQI